MKYSNLTPLQRDIKSMLEDLDLGELAVWLSKEDCLRLTYLPDDNFPVVNVNSMRAQYITDGMLRKNKEIK